ncbi:MAG: sulfotransferase [Bacteroidales bacterium]|nr:sulfotransferase [Bacteroidales bacterium]
MMNKPIIVFGTGRSGSTLFARIMSCADEVVYPSQITSRLPRLLFISKLYLGISKIRILGKAMRRMIHISEAYPFWQSICPLFVEPKHDLTHKDASPECIQKIRKTMGKLAVGPDSRLLFKITGWPRMGFFKKVFPDAVFIHIVRDGRAVANSLLKSDFWDGHLGIDEWRLGRLPEKQIEIFENSNKSQIALAGVYWNTLIESAEMDKKYYSPELMEIKYEELCKNPIEISKDVFEFCGLKWNKRIENEIDGLNVRSMNSKWQTNLSEEQINTVSEVTKENNARLGYLEGNRK